MTYHDIDIFVNFYVMITDIVTALSTIYIVWKLDGHKMYTHVENVPFRYWYKTVSHPTLCKHKYLD